jgi:hypothetical protein
MEDGKYDESVPVHQIENRVWKTPHESTANFAAREREHLRVLSCQMEARTYLTHEIRTQTSGLRLVPCVRFAQLGFCTWPKCDREHG